MSAWRHGTKYGYNDKGCRCGICRQAATAARRDQRRRGRTEKRPSYFRELEAAKILKESYRGVCEECGAATTGCNGPGLAPPLCLRCTAKVRGKAQRGTGHVTESVLEFLSEPRRFSEIQAFLGVTSDYASSMIYQRLLPYGLIERVSRGVYRRVAA